MLGFKYVKTFDTGVARIPIPHPESGFLIGLYNHTGRTRDPFSPLRTGLDHLALAISTSDELAAWTTPSISSASSTQPHTTFATRNSSR